MKFGIKNYEPRFYSTSIEIMHDFASQLKKLKTQRIINVFSMRNKIDEEWNEDSPILLELTSCQLEICNYKLEELALSVNLIDRAHEIEKWDFGEYGKFEYEWRNDRQEFLGFIQAEIVGIEIIEQRFESTLIASKSISEEVEKTTSNWILNGIGFATSKGYFSICNGQDTNQICTYKEDEKYLRSIRVF
ncbi:hypothetical protein QWJ34_14310 [Saccharibacillus sp. CPCC 101409]|uniref:hypothetical protein n=1 Tax=Saccharibacillus sp. CPCC 101409 TaxID=3058041 RepID=UPI002672ABB1|nr:hypothetical protein [Saccharibacillus sp. CPCC 101409]MDO3410941.1 hypothetical protein [Saccharibacillus sp. CPCC 101409]